MARSPPQERIGIARGDRGNPVGKPSGERRFLSKQNETRGRLLHTHAYVADSLFHDIGLNATIQAHVENFHHCYRSHNACKGTRKHERCCLENVASIATAARRTDKENSDWPGGNTRQLAGSLPRECSPPSPSKGGRPLGNSRMSLERATRIILHGCETIINNCRTMNHTKDEGDLNTDLCSGGNVRTHSTLEFRVHAL